MQNSAYPFFLYFLQMMSLIIGVAPITQLRICVIKIVTYKGGHQMR